MSAQEPGRGASHLVGEAVALYTIKWSESTDGIRVSRLKTVMCDH